MARVARGRNAAHILGTPEAYSQHHSLTSCGIEGGEVHFEIPCLIGTPLGQKSILFREVSSSLTEGFHYIMHTWLLRTQL